MTMTSGRVRPCVVLARAFFGPCMNASSAVNIVKQRHLVLRYPHSWVLLENFSSSPARSFSMTATAWKKDRQPEKASSSAQLPPTQDRPRAEDFMGPFASIKDDAIDSAIIASLVASMADGKSSG